MMSPLFFSGGTALRATARELAAREQFSTHLVATWDSGGSSRILRQAFRMPAIGDLRNRLLALSTVPRSWLHEVLSLRIADDISPAAANAEFQKIIEKIHEPLDGESADAIREDLDSLVADLPAGFDCRNASIGNLAMTGAYLRNGGDLFRLAERYARMLRTSGRAMPVCGGNLHLAASLRDGSRIAGQDKFKDIRAPIREFWLTMGEPRDASHETEDFALAPAARDAIAGADLICYSMGSFYSSLLAHFLISGVGRTVAENPAKKVFIPNSGHDPECAGMTIAEQAGLIAGMLARDAGIADARRFLDVILIDAKHGNYPGGITGGVAERMKGLGVEVVDADIVGQDGMHNPGKLLDALAAL